MSIDGLADELVRLEADHAAVTERLVEEKAELSRLESSLEEFQKKSADRQKRSLIEKRTWRIGSLSGVRPLLKITGTSGRSSTASLRASRNGGVSLHAS